MRLLAIFAHPDDELGCVGTLARHAARGDDVMLAWTTHGELASQFVDQSPEEIRRTRQEHGAFVAGRVGAAHTFFDMGDSRMTGSRDEALQVARLYADFKPDAVITWSDDSPHPDHRMTAKIAFDAITLARIPKILAEGAPSGHGGPASGAEPPAPHRSRVRLYQYPTVGSARPEVRVDVSEQLPLAGELFAFYADFYGWTWTQEDFLAARRAAGREAGCEAAERFELRSGIGPARAYLP